MKSSRSAGLARNAIGPLAVFTQGLAAAAPSVAISGTPFALYVAAGKGATWAAFVGLVVVMLIAGTISMQAKRTVSSGSLGTYAGNGLGPGCAYTAGFSLLIGYVGLAIIGVLGGVLYLDAFLDAIGLAPHSVWFRLLLVITVTAFATYLPYRGVALSARYELALEIIALTAIMVLVVASYIRYGPRVDLGQFDPGHLTSSGTYIAAVAAVGSYAGFESVASLGAEAKDPHRTIARSLLRVVTLLGVLYALATYPQIQFFDTIDPDAAVLPQVAVRTGMEWVSPLVSAAVAVTFIVFVTAISTAAARSLFTFAREGALPKVFAKVHDIHRTPWAAVVFIGLLAFVFSTAATLSTAGRLVFDVYGGYVANWGFLVSYLLCVIATPIWLRKVNALTPQRLGISVAAAIGLLGVIASNVYPAPAFPFNILPIVFGLILVAGLLWYWRLRKTKPEVARRIGSIQTLSEEEQQRLADEGIAAAHQLSIAPQTARNLVGRT